MDRALRIAFSAFGGVAALGWVALFVRAPGAAMELLLVTSPVLVTIWLIVTLTARHGPNRRTPAPGAGAADEGSSNPPADPAMSNCASCGDPGTTTVVVRLPGRGRTADKRGRYIILCDRCASTSSLPRAPRMAVEPGHAASHHA